jgi:hypothetical protein
LFFNIKALWNKPLPIQDTVQTIDPRIVFCVAWARGGMGGGKFVLMKDLSSPIFVDARLWGAFRMGYQ